MKTPLDSLSLKQKVLFYRNKIKKYKTLYGQALYNDNNTSLALQYSHELAYAQSKLIVLMDNHLFAIGDNTFLSEEQ